ncbi:AmmeMemoRadiSam system protein A [Aquisphaera insulae]|uniref:AmmeMemoRadiSam system protein A n=1 Tax=Aquisphaera insulae TaxID=2712864 RepID=UPI0013E9C6AF|nr:AmmeMemoRadiSam system protein A [Aquisphaera insulae]
MLPVGEEERALAIGAARRAIAEYLDHEAVIRVDTRAPCLLEARGAFITLRRRDGGELRGCRGECNPTRPLIESIIREAIASATDDPRFSPVTPEELPGLSIRISALTVPKPIAPEEIVVGRHGLIVKRWRRSGLLLPEVPLHFGLRTPEEFLSALYHKAGISPGSFDPVQDSLLAFETESWGEGAESSFSDESMAR